MGAKSGETRKQAATPPRQKLEVGSPKFDPEGWMAERPSYWLDLPDPPLPTRSAWLRHRVAEAAAYFGMAFPESSPQRVSEEEWILLSEMALGPLPRPEKRPKKARPAPPDARKPARKPTAYSPRPSDKTSA